MKKCSFKILTLLSLVLSACSTAPIFDQSKKVESEKGFFFYSFTQDGVSMHEAELAEKLKEIPDAKSKAESAEFLRIGSWIGAGVGGFFLGQGIAKSINNNPGDSATSSYLISISALSFGLLMAHFSNDQLNDAVEIHNTQIGIREIPPIKVNSHSGQGFYFYPVASVDRIYNTNGYYLGTELAFRF